MAHTERLTDKLETLAEAVCLVNQLEAERLTNKQETLAEQSTID